MTFPPEVLEQFGLTDEWQCEADEVSFSRNEPSPGPICGAPLGAVKRIMTESYRKPKDTETARLMALGLEPGYDAAPEVPLLYEIYAICSRGHSTFLEVDPVKEPK